MNSQPINPWLSIENELENAQLARNNGNEGKSRVCARRAVSQALVLSGITSIRGLGAIQSLTDNTSIPLEIREYAGPFLEKVDESHQLPSGIDLIKNARIIILYIKESRV